MRGKQRLKGQALSHHRKKKLSFQSELSGDRSKSSDTDIRRGASDLEDIFDKNEFKIYFRGKTFNIN